MRQISLPSEFRSRQAWEAEAWRELVGGFVGAKSLKEVDRLLAVLLTVHEKVQIINRAAAAMLLEHGKSYREIGKALWLSPATISAISKGLREEKYTSRHTRNKRKAK